MKVRGVISKQGTDLAPLINAAAGQDALALTALLRAESGLDEKAWRYTKWPDCSSGLSQVIAANLGFGTYQTPATDDELVLYRAYVEQPANAIREGWRFFRPALVRMGGDPVLSMCSYNLGPNAAGNPAQLRALIAAGQAGSADPLARKAAHAWTHYGQHWEAAQAYAIPEEEPMPPTTADPFAAFIIGPGVKQAMLDAGDEPRGHEDYTHSPQDGGLLYSWTEGRDARYRFTPQDGVKRLPFD